MSSCRKVSRDQTAPLADCCTCFIFHGVSWHRHLNLCCSPKPFQMGNIQQLSKGIFKRFNNKFQQQEHDSMNKIHAKPTLFQQFSHVDWRILILQKRLCLTLLHFQTKWRPLSAETCRDPTAKFFAQRLFFSPSVCVYGDEKRIKWNRLLTISFCSVCTPESGVQQEK